MSEVDCKTYSVFETYPRATPKPSLTSRDHLLYMAGAGAGHQVRLWVVFAGRV